MYPSRSFTEGKQAVYAPLWFNQEFDIRVLLQYTRSCRSHPGWEGMAAGCSDNFSASKRIDELIANLGDWRGHRLAEVRRIIHEVYPEMVEDWKWRGTPVWSHEGMYANINAFKDKVNLTFFRRAHLSDPNRVFGTPWPTGHDTAKNFQLEARLGIVGRAQPCLRGAGSRREPSPIGTTPRRGRCYNPCACRCVE